MTLKTNDVELLCNALEQVCIDEPGDCMFSVSPTLLQIVFKSEKHQMSIRGNLTIVSIGQVQFQSQRVLQTETQQGQFTQYDVDNQQMDEMNQNSNIYSHPYSTQTSTASTETGALLTLYDNGDSASLQPQFWVESKLLNRSCQAFHGALKYLEDPLLVINLPTTTDDCLMLELSGSIKSKKNTFNEITKRRIYKTIIQLNLKQVGTQLPADVFRYNDEHFCAILNKSYFTNITQCMRNISNIDSLLLRFTEKRQNKHFDVSFKSKDGYEGIAETPSSNINIGQWLFEEKNFSNIEIRIRNKTLDFLSYLLEKMSSKAIKLVIEPKQRLILKLNAMKSNKKAGSFLYVLTAFKDLNAEVIEDDI